MAYERLAELTSEEFWRWVRPAETFGRNKHLPRGHVIAAIFQRIADDEITAVAAKVTVREAGEEPTAHELVPVPKRLWSESEAISSSDDFWSTGSIIFQTQDQFGRRMSLSCLNVRFDPDGVEQLVADCAPPPLEAAGTTPPKGQTVESRPRGRPPWPLWHELWADLAAALATKEFVASKQADIEGWMQEWAAERDVSLGESTAREPAAMLWKTLQRKARK